MAPELYNCNTAPCGEKKHYTNKVDVYSFGIVLWGVADNRMLFKGSLPGNKLEQIIEFFVKSINIGLCFELGENVLHLWFFEMGYGHAKACFHSDPVLKMEYFYVF
ncbi:hypothetical protein HPP92_013340 [Vanilla planifolia]|uniref:Protein kinase domain-containing protein n=1 Tax=Vanilla planifolia TaxID=51239 RepID=A0A835QWU8_VANPL|nr:hypothetical protein HPP92_013340 [Vanilla planifolia]